MSEYYTWNSLNFLTSARKLFMKNSTNFEESIGFLQVYHSFTHLCLSSWANGLHRHHTYSLLYFRFEHNHAESSCKWTDPPDDGHNYRLCNSGICNGEKGSYSKNGTLRFTKCRKHFVLAEGFDKDVCKDGVWSSSGHRCIRELMFPHRGVFSSFHCL